MSRAKLNIWLRYADCSLITDCWRTDLVIKTCSGEPLVEMDPTIIEKLKEKYEGYQEISVHDYAGEKRIKLYPGGEGRVYHVEVYVPPGCYIIWTRVCYNRNEETNKVMVIADCDDEACVNLLLDSVETCSNELLHPLLERAVEMGIPKLDQKVVAKVLMKVAEKSKREVVAEIGRRLEEVAERKDPRLQKTIGAIRDIVKAIPDKKELIEKE